MITIVFLGNPGKKYDKTRHNIGFITGEYFSVHHGIRINKKAFNGHIGTGRINKKDILLLFPLTYMNESGKSVKSAMNFYNTDHSNLIVVHDELELDFGIIKTKFAGGHKGHNGLRSIIKETGSANFHRIRLGIGRPENENISVADHVLSRFTSEEISKISDMMPMANDFITSIIENII